MATAPPAIPPELTDRIIDYLHDDPRTLSNCSLTCWSWVPASRLHRFRNVDLRCTSVATLLSILKTSLGAPVGNYVQSLTVTGCRTYVWHDLKPECPCYNYHANLNIPEVLARMPALRELRIAELPITLFASAPRSIEVLELFRLHALTTAAMMEWMSSFPRLRSLVSACNYVYCNGEDDASWEAEGSPMQMHLADVRTYFWLSSASGPTAFSKWLFSHNVSQQLHTFSLDLLSLEDGCIGAFKRAVHALGPSLRILEVQCSTSSLYDEILQDLTFAQCTNLQEVRLMGMVGVWDKVLVHSSLGWAAPFLSNLAAPSITTVTFILDAERHEPPTEWLDDTLPLLARHSNLGKRLERVALEFYSRKKDAPRLSDGVQSFISYLASVWEPRRREHVVLEVKLGTEMVLPPRAQTIALWNEDDEKIRWCEGFAPEIWG